MLIEIELKLSWNIYLLLIFSHSTLIFDQTRSAVFSKLCILASYDFNAKLLQANSYLSFFEKSLK